VSDPNGPAEPPAQNEPPAKNEPPAQNEPPAKNEPPAQTEPPAASERVKVSGADPAAREERRRERARIRLRRRRIVAAVCGAVVVIVLGFVLWYELESHALGPEGRREVVQVTSGESVSAVASQLAARHVIGSSLAFRIYDLVHGSPTIDPGIYLLHQNQTFGQVHAILAGGPNIYVVSVSRGLTLQEVATRVDDLPGHGGSSFVRVADSGAVHSVFSPAGSNNLEGMLGTGTYRVLPGESDTAILTDMVHRFDAQATAAGLSASSASALGLTPYQVITAASIVEKEGYVFKNMPDVARVIYNRLAAGTPLQMNATVLYSLGQDGGPVTSKDLALQTPYNTYLNVGLTPTPISIPSPQALTAAVHPPPGSWLYFVLVKKDGTEAFADTYAEQLANEALAHARGVG
jgi:UPF0755 protein